MQEAKRNQYYFYAYNNLNKIFNYDLLQRYFSIGYLEENTIAKSIKFQG